MLPKNLLSKMMVQEAIAQLNTVSKTVEVFRAEMNRLAKELPKYETVMSLYGAGKSLGPQLMAGRFAHKGSLTAFAGVDPGPNQSEPTMQRALVHPSEGRLSYARRSLYS